MSINCDECGKQIKMCDTFIVSHPPDEANRVEEFYCSQTCIGKRFK